MNNKSAPDFYLCGLSGSGKDTVSDFLVNNYGYVKLRLAKTIKSVIAESQFMTQEEIDIAKRRPETGIREKHWEISNLLDSQISDEAKKEYPDLEFHSAYRFKSLLEGSNIDYEIYKNIVDRPRTFCDLRMISEIKALFKYGLNYRQHAVIFFTRNLALNDSGKDKTEVNIFEQKELYRQIKYLSESQRTNFHIHFICNKSDENENRKDMEYLGTKIQKEGDMSYLELDDLVSFHNVANFDKPNNLDLLYETVIEIYNGK